MSDRASALTARRSAGSFSAGGSLRLEVEADPESVADRQVATSGRALRAGGGAPGGLGFTGRDDGPPRLGWVDLPRSIRPQVAAFERLRDELLDEGLNRLVVVGMGGAGLSSRTLASVLPASGPGLEIVPMNSLAPEAVREMLEPEALGRTAFLIASKSGTTVETCALESVIVGALGESGGKNLTARRMMAVSDPGSPLDLRARNDYRKAWIGRADVGGRFSALDAYGVLPAVLGGRDAAASLEPAIRLRNALDEPTSAEADAGFELGARLARLRESGRWRARLSADGRAAGLIPWLEQLFAEGSGKDGRGIFPVRAPAKERMAAGFTDEEFLIELNGAPGRNPAADGIAADVPVVRFRFDPGDALAAMFFWQISVAVASHRMGVDPYDQPDIDGSKALARALIAGPRRRDGSLEPPPPGEREIAAFLAACSRPGSGLVVNAFGHESEAARDALERFQADAGRALGSLPALGFGPQVLHSLGQMEKGGPPGIGVLLLTWEPGAADVPVPPGAGMPRMSPGLGTKDIARLQAAADERTLRERGRRVLWLHAERPDEAGLSELLARLRAGLARASERTGSDST